MHVTAPPGCRSQQPHRLEDGSTPMMNNHEVGILQPCHSTAEQISRPKLIYILRGSPFRARKYRGVEGGRPYVCSRLIFRTCGRGDQISSQELMRSILASGHAKNHVDLPRGCGPDSLMTSRSADQRPASFGDSLKKS